MENKLPDISTPSNHTERKSLELEKTKSPIIIEIIECVPNTVGSKSPINNVQGNITDSSFDESIELADKTSPFDNYIQIIDGATKVVINEKTYKLKFGICIIITALAA